MNTFGKNGLIGLGIGATAGAGVVGFLIYKEVSRKRNQDPDEPEASLSSLIASPNEVDGQHTPTFDVQGMKRFRRILVSPSLLQILFTMAKFECFEFCVLRFLRFSVKFV